MRAKNELLFLFALAFFAQAPQENAPSPLATEDPSDERSRFERCTVQAQRRGTLSKGFAILRRKRTIWVCTIRCVQWMTRSHPSRARHRQRLQLRHSFSLAVRARSSASRSLSAE